MRRYSVLPERLVKLVVPTCVLAMALIAGVVESREPEPRPTVSPMLDRFAHLVAARTPPSARILVVNGDQDRVEYERFSYLLLPRTLDLALDGVGTTSSRLTWRRIYQDALSYSDTFIILWRDSPSGRQTGNVVSSVHNGLLLSLR